MSRLTTCTNQLKQKNRKALVCYLVCGDPYPSATLHCMREMASSGVDIIELGIPFSDPMAEGPIIQRGHERALKHHISLQKTIDQVQEFRKHNQTTPVILMGYANPIEQYGYEEFAGAALRAGIDGVIVVDLPPEEAKALNLAMKKQELHNIFLLAPTTSHNRAQMIFSEASGFVYYVSLKGVTGAGHIDVSHVKLMYNRFKELSDLPLYVGFGIKDAEIAQKIAEFSDGIVIGSAIVDTMGKMDAQNEIEIATSVGNFVRAIRAAIDK